MVNHPAYPNTDLPRFFQSHEPAPMQVLRNGPTRYGPLRHEANGSWKFVYSNLEPVALIWTDWEEGFDVIRVGADNDIFTRLSNYVITSKAHDIPAGWAFTSVKAFIKKFHEEDAVTLGPHNEGKLIGASRAASGKRGEEDVTS